MKITFLGTGTSTGVPYIGCECNVCCSTDERDKRLRCSAWIEVEGKHILIDCGPDFRQQALRSGIPSIDALLLTHEHFDHLGGMDDLRPFGNVDVYADRHTLDSVRRIYSYCFNNNSYPGIPLLKLHEIENCSFTAAGIEIMPIKAYHYQLPVLGYRIGNMAYLTDFKTIDPEEEKKLLNLDLLVVDALRHKAHISHVSLSETLELIRRVSPNRSYLIHMSHEMGLHVAEKELLPPNVHFAYDCLQLYFK